MIVLLDTSVSTARLGFVVDGSTSWVEWQADRQLAKGLLGWLDAELRNSDKTWSDIEAIGVRRGPGSFTGLRIGIAVMNTLAESLSVSIVGEVGDTWDDVAIDRLHRHENDGVVLPYYDRDATITTQRK